MAKAAGKTKSPGMKFGMVSTATPISMGSATGKVPLIGTFSACFQVVAGGRMQSARCPARGVQSWSGKLPHYGTTWSSRPPITPPLQKDRWGKRSQAGHIPASGAEAFPAGTTAGSVRIPHFEPRFIESLHVVQFAARHVEDAFGIDDNANSGTFDKNIAVIGAILQVHLVLKPGTPAANDGDAQYAVRHTLFLEQLSNSAPGSGCDANDAFIALAKAGRGGAGAAIGCNHTNENN